MLILTRRASESIQIGDDIEIKILNTTNQTVKIAIEAPKDILILRKELVKEVADNNAAASTPKQNLLDLLAKKIFKDISGVLPSNLLVSNNASDLILESVTGSSIWFYSSEQGDKIRGITNNYLISNVM